MLSHTASYQARFFSCVFVITSLKYKQVLISVYFQTSILGYKDTRNHLDFVVESNVFLTTDDILFSVTLKHTFLSF